MEKEIKSSNYYLKYLIEVAQNEIDGFDAEKDRPELFFERNYERTDLNYELYMVVPTWYESCENITNKEKLPFDTVNILYDVKGYDVSSLEYRANIKTYDEVKKIEIQKTFVFDNESDNSVDDKLSSYRNNLYRIPLVDNTFNDFSGTVMVTFFQSKNPAKKVVYYLAINFIYKKRIYYSIDRKKDNVIFTFEAKDVSEKISFRCFHNEKYMCLKEDFNADSFNFDVDFTTSDKVVLHFKSSKEFRNHKYSLTFDDVLENSSSKKHKVRDFNDFYILECKENKTLKIARQNVKVSRNLPICPYCHKEIRILEDKKKDEEVLTNNYTSYQKVDLKHRNKLYRKGGISCQGRLLLVDNKPEKIYNNQGRIAKDVIYCEDDAFESNVNGVLVSDIFNSRPRLLPDKFLSHDSHKVFILGAARAGKSTYISKLFDITASKGSTDVNIPATSISNAIKKLIDKNVHSVVPSKVVSQDGKFKKTLERWYSSDGNNDNQSFYGGYSINFGNNRSYPKPTTTSNESMSRLPFILEIGKSDYISFYDIAGEDAQKGTGEVTKIMSSDNMGVFCLINPTKSAREDNRKVFETLKAYLGEGKNCPIAIIVTKFDTIEKLFDPSAYCLRNDYFDLNDSNAYEESYLEHCIDMASEEIKSYLDKELPSFDFGSQNVKYFGVSAMSTSSALYHESQKTKGKEEKNYLNFKCSGTRIELPLIWMMKQLGIIL